jgi:RNA polymerase sigma-70 factor (ECF subfamily)
MAFGESMKLKETPDAFLVERVQRGDMGSLDRLIERHQARAYQFAFRLTRNSDEAADVVASAFVRVYRSIGNFKGQCAFTSWLYRIVTNCYLDIKKQKSRTECVSVDGALDFDGKPMDLELEYTGASAFDEYIRGEKNQAIEGALEELPEYQKAILLMYHVQMLTYEEIADVIEAPIGTVKSRLNRARGSLSQAMSGFRSLFVDGPALTAAA